MWAGWQQTSNPVRNMTLRRRITQVKARPVAAYLASHQAPTVFVYWAGHALVITAKFGLF